MSAIGLRDRGKGTVWVDAGTARPVRIDMPGQAGPERLTFSEYDQVKQPTVPPAAQVLDSSVLEG